MSYRNLQDKKKKEALFFKTLDLQSKIANEYSNAIGDYQDNKKLNIAPVVQKEPTPEEKQSDHNLQRKIAFDNLKTVSSPRIAEDIINNISSIDDFSDIVLLNQNWADVLRQLKGKKDITLNFWTPFWTKYKEVLAETGNTGIEDFGKLKEDIIKKVEQTGSRIEDVIEGVDGPEEDTDFLRDDPFNVSKNYTKGTHYFRNVVNPFPNTLFDDYAPGVPNQRMHNLFNELSKYNRRDLENVIRDNFTIDERNADGVGRRNLADWKRLNPQDFLQELTEALIDKNLFFDRTQGFGLFSSKQPKIFQKGHQKIRLHREGQRKIFGKGISPSERPRYYEFGKHRIHADSLDKNILNLKYKSLTGIAKMPIQNISSDLKLFIEDVINTGKVNKTLFNKLEKSDKDLFYKIAKLSDIDMDFDYDDGTKEELERYNLVKGQILAGNNNSEILKEMQYLIIKFMNSGLLPKQESTNLLYQLSILA
jgi:hypothetical protein